MSQLVREKKAPPWKADGGFVATAAIENAPAAHEECEPTQAEKNLAFAKMSAPERRRAIARDVKAQIAAGRYTPEHMIYVNVKRGALNARLNTAMHGDVDCAVCGVGAIFVSTMLLSQARMTLAEVRDFSFVYDDDRGFPDGRKEIRRHFGPAQLALIELAFEGHLGFVGDCARYMVPRSTIDRAYDFHEKHEPLNGEAASSRMLEAIMDNIIEHGEFKP